MLKVNLKVQNMWSDTKNYLGPPKSLIDSKIFVDNTMIDSILKVYIWQ